MTNKQTLHGNQGSLGKGVKQLMVGIFLGQCWQETYTLKALTSNFWSRLSAIKKEWNSAICDNTDWTWGHYVKWNESERQILFDLPCIQFSSIAQSCPTLCNSMDCRMPGFPVHQQLPEPTQTHVHHVCNAIQNLILCHSLLPLPSIFPRIRVFSNELVLQIKWPKY